jgi:hypothetical protein
MTVRWGKLSCRTFDPLLQNCQAFLHCLNNHRKCSNDAELFSNCRTRRPGSHLKEQEYIVANAIRPTAFVLRTCTHL